ncbi:MAG: hypothetical protein ABI639_11520 [Thermoanaerobaculia bacterium]
MSNPSPVSGFWFWLPIGLVVLGNLAYHLGLKDLAPTVHPLTPLLILFSTAALTTLALRLSTGRVAELSGEFSRLGWRPFVVGMSIILIELGFLLAYRTGWKISAAAVTANILVGIALLAVGAIAFREPLSLSRVGGVATCLAGLWLLTRG